LRDRADTSPASPIFEASIGGKWLQLLKEADPRVVRVAVIYNPHTAPFAVSFLHSVQSAAPTVAVHVVDMPVEDDADIETAARMFTVEPGGGLIAIPDSFTVGRRDVIVALAARHRLPALYSAPSFTSSGGLMAYAVDTRDTMQRAAGYIDRILKGTKPADLPVQAPVKFELSINLKTARALGLGQSARSIFKARPIERISRRSQVHQFDLMIEGPSDVKRKMLPPKESVKILSTVSLLNWHRGELGVDEKELPQCTQS
jgi:hypothetical protein